MNLNLQMRVAVLEAEIRAAGTWARMTARSTENTFLHPLADSPARAVWRCQRKRRQHPQCLSSQLHQDAVISESQPHLPGSDPHLLPPGRQPGDRYSYSPLMSHRVTPTSPSPTFSHSHSYSASYSPVPTSRFRTISDPQASLEPPQAQNQTASTSILRRKVLSKETVRQYQEKALQRQGSKGQREGQGSPSRNSQSAMQVPWEKEVSKEGLLGLGLCLGQGKDARASVVQDQGLLEEIESMCCLGSVLHTSLQLSQVHCNNSHHQVQGKATDES